MTSLDSEEMLDTNIELAPQIEQDQGDENENDGRDITLPFDELGSRRILDEVHDHFEEVKPESQQDSNE